MLTTAVILYRYESVIYLNDIAVSDEKVPLPEEEQDIEEYDYCYSSIGFVNTNIDSGYTNATELSAYNNGAKETSEVTLSSCPAYRIVEQQ